jgi:nucleotide-binding universal stress UspA family protein
MVGESIIKGRGEFSTNQIEGLLRETKEAHRQSLIEFLQQHPLEDLKYNVYLLKGEAGELITELAQTKAVDLIIMGTISRAGIAGLLIGNTAEKVLRKVDSSILVIKPEGFITPVKLNTL